MILLLAVDPGIRGCGLAVFRDGALAWAAYARNPAESGDGPAEAAAAARAAEDAVGFAFASGAVFGEEWRGDWHFPHEVVVEWPRVYQRGGGRTVGDPNDLRALCAVDGALARVFQSTRFSYVEPAEWKGQLDKAAMGRRIRGRLAPGEVAVLDAALKVAGKALGHNVVDAVGIGLHHLGRLERVRVCARE